MPPSSCFFLEELEPRLMLSATVVEPPRLRAPTPSTPGSITEVEPNPPDSPQQVDFHFTSAGDTDTVQVLGQVATPQDEDAFSFTAEEGQLIVVSVTNTGGQWEPYLQIFDAEGNLLKVSREPGPSYDARLVYVAPADGTYVTAVSDAHFESTGTYSLTITRTDPVDLTGSFVPAGDGVQEATVADQIEPGGEWDFYTFHAPPGRALTVDVTTPNSNLDSVVEVFDPTGWWIGGNDDRSPQDVDPYAQTVLIGEGYYGVLVEGFDGEEVGSYQMTVRYQQPTLLTYNASGTATTSGEITEDVGARIFRLGEIPAGTPIHLEATSQTADLVVGLYRSDGTSVVLVDDVGTQLNPSFDTILRASDEYFVVVDAVFGDTGQFDLTVDIDPAGVIPPPQGQLVFVDFDGRTGTFQGDLSPFDGAAVGFPGQTDALIQEILSTLQEAYAPYNVTFLDSEPASGEYSVVVITGDSESGLLGIAESVDPLNQDPSETAVVYGGSFPSLIGSVSLEEMGTALGNVAAHELGHLLGLSHVADHHRIMDDQGRAEVLVQPQSFGSADVSFTTLLQQDSAALLRHILGPWGPVDAQHPFEFTDADGDRIRVELTGPGQFVLVDAGGLLPEDGENAVMAWFDGDFDSSTTVTFTDLNPGVGGDDISLDSLLASAPFGGVVAPGMELGEFAGVPPAADGAGLVVGSLGGLDLAQPLAGTIHVDDLTGDAVIPGIASAGSLLVDGSITHDLTISGGLAGTLTCQSLVGLLRVEGRTSGAIHITGPLTGQLQLMDDLTGTVEVDGDSAGGIHLSDDLSAAGALHVAGSAAEVRVGDDVRGLIDIDGDLTLLDIGDHLASSGVVSVGGDLVEGHIRGPALGALQLTDLTGVLTLHRDFHGQVTIAGGLDGELRFARDLFGSLTLEGVSSGAVSIGDDLERGAVVDLGPSLAALHVADNLKTGFTAGNLGLLEVGHNVFSSAQVNIAGTLGGLSIGRNLNGDIVVGGLTGPVEIGRHLNYRGSLVVSDASPVEASVTVGGDIRGEFSTAGAYLGVLTVGDDIGRYAVLAFGGGSEFELHVGDDIKGDFSVDGDISVLEVGDTVYARSDIGITGNLGGLSIGRNLNGDIVVGGLTGPVEIGRHLNYRGSLVVSGADPVDQPITIGGDLRGILEVGGGLAGEVVVGDDITTVGRLHVVGSAAGISVADQIRGRVRVEGDLGTLEVGRGGLGGRAVVDIAGDLGGGQIEGSSEGTLVVAGLLTGDLTVGGHLDWGGATTLTGGIDADATLSVGGDVRQDLLLGTVLGEVSIGDDLRGRLTVTGDLGSAGGGEGGQLHIADDATGRIYLQGDVYGDISVGDYLAFLDSHGQAQPADPSLAPIDYVFMVAGNPEGTLTVGGNIGRVI